MLMIQSLEITKMNNPESSTRIIECDIPLRFPLGERSGNGYIMNPELFRSAFDKQINEMTPGLGIPIVLKENYDKHALDNVTDIRSTSLDETIGYAMSVDDEGKTIWCKFINYGDDIQNLGNPYLYSHVTGKITYTETLDENTNLYVDVDNILRFALTYEK